MLDLNSIFSDLYIRISVENADVQKTSPFFLVYQLINKNLHHLGVIVSVITYYNWSYFISLMIYLTRIYGAYSAFSELSKDM